MQVMFMVAKLALHVLKVMAVRHPGGRTCAG